MWKMIIRFKRCFFFWWIERKEKKFLFVSSFLWNLVFFFFLFGFFFFLCSGWKINYGLVIVETDGKTKTKKKKNQTKSKIPRKGWKSKSSKERKKMVKNLSFFFSFVFFVLWFYSFIYFIFLDSSFFSFFLQKIKNCEISCFFFLQKQSQRFHDWTFSSFRAFWKKKKPLKNHFTFWEWTIFFVSMFDFDWLITFWLWLFLFLLFLLLIDSKEKKKRRSDFLN